MNLARSEDAHVLFTYVMQNDEVPHSISQALPRVEQPQPHIQVLLRFCDQRSAEQAVGVGGGGGG